MPNHEIIASLGIIPFWEIIQGAVNSHYHNLHVKDWDKNDAMSVLIRDDKTHLNYKVPNTHDNRLVMVNHTVDLTGTKLILWRCHYNCFEVFNLQII